MKSDSFMAVCLCFLLSSSGLWAVENWQLLTPETTEATAGVTLQPSKDGALLARSPKATPTTYTILAAPSIETVVAIRLEVLPHDTLPRRGPGRSANGNFILSHFTAQLIPPKGAAVPLRIASATADYEQGSYAARSALDGKDLEAGWAIGGREGSAHSAIFRLASPVTIKAGSKIQVQMVHGSKKWADHAIGHFRLSVTDKVTAVAKKRSKSAPGSGDVRVLIVTGEEHPAHNWRTRTDALEEIFAEDSRFAVTVTEDPEFLADEAIFKHDVILLNFYSAKKNYPGAKSRQQLQKFVKDGGGLFVLHFACGAFHDWPEFANLTGLIFTPKHKYKGHHDGRQPFLVDIIDKEHAITKGMKPQLQADDELYYCMGGKTRDFRLLATARSKNTGEDHPMAFCLEYGKGRVFNTPLGHDARACKLPDVAELIRRGTLWASAQDYQLGKVILDETPHDPFELAVAKDGRVFYVERRGAVKQCLPESKSSTLIGKLEVYTKLDDGLLGLALDPDFLNNSWMYLCYSTPTASENWVSRFTLKDGKIDMDSEKVLLKIAVQRDTPPCHTGGSLTFDTHGNLLISTGDNINPFKSSGFCPTDERPGRAAWDGQGTSGNTNDLRGKILRITPQPDGTVTIPAGNLFKPGQAKTRPEIFVMGCRNPFRISADQKTGAVYWGEVGPDSRAAKAERGPAGFDEMNQAKQAGNYGWPHFVADNKAYRRYDFATKVSGELWDPAAPKNKSVNNTGLVDLPAAQVPLIWYPYAPSTRFPAVGSGGRSAMGGPVYYFDPDLKSERKLPAAFDHCLFVYDWARGWVLSAKLGDNEELLSLKRVLPKTRFKRPMDMELGADGALYMIEWGSGYSGNNKDAQIVRIESMPTDAEATAVATAPAVSMSTYLPALASGNAKTGQKLFENGNKTGCVNCHRVNGKGGVIGPPLDGCGSRMKAAAILESLLFPGKTVAEGYGTLIVTMKDGSSHAGVLKREDNSELQLESPEKGSMTLKTKDIASRSKLVSGMPEIAAALSVAEVSDLVAYLSSLKAKTKD